MPDSHINVFTLVPGTISPAEFSAARRAYTAIRQEYDGAVDELRQAQQMLREASSRIESAGYGVPAEDAGIAVRGVGAQVSETSGAAIPRTVYENPRSPSLNAAIPGFDPASAAAGGAAGAMSEEGEEADPLRIAGGALAAGILGRKGMSARERAAWQLAQRRAAKASSGLGNVPPSKLKEPTLPGMEPERTRSISEMADEVLGPAGEAAPVSSVRAEGGQTYLPTQSPGAIPRLRAALAPWLERASTVRYAGMLSDTAGHSQNIQSNLVLQLADILTTPIAATIDVGRVGVARAAGGPIGRKLGTSREVFYSETPAQLLGIRAGIRENLPVSAEIMRTGMRPDDPSKFDRKPVKFGTNIPGVAPAGTKRAATIDFAFEYPLRALSAADAIFRGGASRGHMAAESLAEATRLNGGKAPSAEQIQQAMQAPKVVKRADELAARSVLQEDRRVTKWYRNMLEKAPPEVRVPLQTEVPFVRTPYNIVAQGMGLTDVGALAGVIQDVVQKKSARHIEQRLARAVLGTAVTAWATADYADGVLTGPYPSDQNEASTLPPGWRPWSRKFEVFGETYYYPIVVLGPFAVPAVYAILRAEAIKKGKDAWSSEWAGDVAMGVGRYAEQETFLEGLGALSKVFDQRRGEVEMGRHIEQIVSQYSPHVLGGGGLGREIQRITGMPARDPEGGWEAMLATHPLTAGQVRPRQDVIGREQSMGLGGPAGAFIRAGVEDDAPVIAAFRSANQGLPSAGPKSIIDPATKQVVRLDADQRAAWERAFGDSLQQEWMSSGYSYDARRLVQVESKARESARRAVLGR